MISLTVAVLAALGACGVLLVAYGAVARPVPLAEFAQGLSSPVEQKQTKLGWLAGSDEQIGVCLGLVQLSVEDWIARRAMFILGGALFGAALGVFVYVLGLAPIVIVLLVAVAFGWGGAWVAVAVLKEQAEVVRREITMTVAVFLTLTQALMAGGSGINSAMEGAATAGKTRSFNLLLSAMRDATARKEDPYVGLANLGHRIGGQDLIQLARSLQQATEGSRVAESLQARAEALRTRERLERVAAMESRASATSWPIVLVAVAFVVLIIYPPLSALLAS